MSGQHWLAAQQQAMDCPTAGSGGDWRMCVTSTPTASEASDTSEPRYSFGGFGAWRTPLGCTRAAHLPFAS